ncbi:MAG: A24 family peptidase [Phycisphaerae bacterium]
MLYMFVVGACVGSFLNVVIYRLPRGLFFARTRSFCPVCERKIPLHENIPVLSWFLLRGKCSGCGCAISPRYVFVEIFTGLFFALLYFLCFHMGTISFSRLGTDYTDFFAGGWWLYLAHCILFACLIAGSAIDFELYLIPMSLCVFATTCSILASAAAPFFIAFETISKYGLFPVIDVRLSALPLGLTAGMIIANILLKLRLIRPSYEGLELSSENRQENICENYGFNDRAEMLKECVFLLPIMAGALLAWKYLSPLESWQAIASNPYVNCLLGSIMGYFVGAGCVWLMRILGTLGFGREAMGLGDVHLMGAIGALSGSSAAVVIFFTAPFLGLALSSARLFTKKIKEIPYGPFLSIAAVFVIIFHNAVFGWLNKVFLPAI